MNSIWNSPPVKNKDPAQVTEEDGKKLYLFLLHCPNQSEKDLFLRTYSLDKSGIETMRMAALAGLHDIQNLKSEQMEYASKMNQISPDMRSSASNIFKDKVAKHLSEYDEKIQQRQPTLALINDYLLAHDADHVLANDTETNQPKI